MITAKRQLCPTSIILMQGEQFAILEHLLLKVEKFRSARVSQGRGRLLEQMAKIVEMLLAGGRFLPSIAVPFAFEFLLA